MERIGFIGEYDKTDLILYVAKLLTEFGKKVLIFDATNKQKTRYIVPAINPTLSYITQFKDIDVSVGFKNFEQLQEYLGTDINSLKYDYILIDIDNSASIDEIGLMITDKVYYVTSFDLYTLKKGVEILSDLKAPLKLIKVYFSRTFYKEDDEYLDFLTLGKKIVWDDNVIYFPLENGDGAVIAENERLGKIKFKNLSNDYKEGIISLINNILGVSPKNVKNIMKNLE